MDYNQGTMYRKFFYITLLIIILFTQSSFRSESRSSAPGAYELIDTVNAYRISMGLYALDPESHVMAAAQSHADWIVSTGNGGHTGASGSDETMRAYWAGYGGGKSIKCDEAWASTTSVNSAVFEAWSDWTHQQVMLNGWGNKYTDVGAGVADNGDGTFVFILDVCLTQGGSAPDYKPNAPIDPNATPDMSNYIFGVTSCHPGAGWIHCAYCELRPDTGDHLGCLQDHDRRIAGVEWYGGRLYFDLAGPEAVDQKRQWHTRCHANGAGFRYARSRTGQDRNDHHGAFLYSASQDQHPGTLAVDHCHQCGCKLQGRRRMDRHNPSRPLG